MMYSACSWVQTIFENSVIFSDISIILVSAVSREDFFDESFDKFIGLLPAWWLVRDKWEKSLLIILWALIDSREDNLDLENLYKLMGLLILQQENVVWLKDRSLELMDEGLEDEFVDEEVDKACMEIMLV